MSTVPQRNVLINARPNHAPDESWFDAIHQASHAVIADALGVAYGDVRYIPGDEHQGNRLVDDRLFGESWDGVWRAAVVRLAGEVAEYVAEQRSLIGRWLIAREIREWSVGMYPPTIDRDKAFMAVAAAAVGSDFGKVMGALVDATFALVDCKWPTVEHVAIELQKRGVLSAANLRALVVATARNEASGQGSHIG